MAKKQLGVRTNPQTMDEVRQAVTVIVNFLDDLQSSNATKGASLIGVADAGAVWTGTDLETVLDEIDARLVAGGL